MIKLKYLVPVMAVSLTSICTFPITSCKKDSHPDEPIDDGIKVSLDKSVEHISLKTIPETPVWGEHLQIYLSADKDYVLEGIGVCYTSGISVPTQIAMIQDASSATVDIDGWYVISDLVVKAIAVKKTTTYHN